VRIPRVIELLAVCLFAATVLFAQTPAPTIEGNLVPVWVTDQREVVITPDDHALTGGELAGIGSWENRQSYFDPSLRFVETLDSNPASLASNNGSYRGFSAFGASLRLLQYLGRDTKLLYSGAVRYDSRAAVQGYDQVTNTQNFAFGSALHMGKLTLRLADQVQYSQGSGFGLAGMEGMGLTGQQNSLLGLQSMPTPLRSDLAPNQSVLIGRVGVVDNATLAELDARLSDRDTVTVEGSYGILHFDSSQFASAEQSAAVGGYNRKLTDHDSIALEAAVARIQYQRLQGSIDTEYLSLLYSRQITGSLSFVIGGGPQRAQPHLTPGPNPQRLNGQGRCMIQFHASRFGLSASATHAVTNGSGVLQGTKTSTAQGSLSLAFSPLWTASLSSGFSRNVDLNTPSRYDTLFTSFVLNHRMGHYANIFLSYDLQRQTSGTVCTGPACAYGGLRNVFGLGLSWDGGQIPVR
jgi:hypothetical protein